MNIRVRMTDTATSFLNTMKNGVPSRRSMGHLAGVAKVYIAQRTQAGKDERGQAFDDYRTAPYFAPVESRRPGVPAPQGGLMNEAGTYMEFDSYADYKLEMGRGADVTLTLSGETLGAIKFLVLSSTKARLFFGSRLHSAIAHGHHTGYYPFFGLEDVGSGKELEKALLKDLKEVRARARQEAASRKGRKR